MNISEPCMKSGLRILSLLAATVLHPGTSAFCQTFEWANQPLVSSTFGGSDEGRAVAKDASGNVYVTGFFAGTADFDPGAGTANLSSAGGQDIFIAKYNASGNYVWANRIGGASNDIAYAIALDGSGNVHVTGYMQGSNVDFDPGAGTANLSSAGAWDIFIAKYDASGNYLWANRMGGTSSEVGYGIALDGSGNVHITGAFLSTTADFDPGIGTANLSNAGNDDIFVAKYDVSGNYLWAARTGGTNSDIGYGIAVDGSGNVHVTGSFQGSNVDFDPGAGAATLSSAGNSDIFISKYDASGNYVWAKRLGGTTADEGYGIALDGSGNVHVTGHFQSSSADFDPGAGTVNLSTAGGRDVFIAKYDASGNYVWAKQMGGTNNDNGYGVAVDGSGNVHVAGDFLSSTVDFDPGAGTANLSTAGSTDIFAAKYDASGNYVWAGRMGDTGIDNAYGLALDGSGNVLVTGSFQGGNVDFNPGAGTANLTAGYNNRDAFALRLSSAGAYDWAVNWGGVGNQPTLMECRAIARDASGNIYATGSFQGSNVDFDPGAGTAYLSSAGLADIFIAKYSASGSYEWAKRIGGAGSDAGLGLTLDGSANVYVTGYFTNSNVDFDPGAGTENLSSAGASDMFFAKYDASGNFVWAKRGAAGASNTDEGQSIALDGSGNIFISGFFRDNNVDFDPGAGTANLTSAGQADIFIAKYDASGNYVWAKRAGGTLDDVGRSLALDGSGNVYVTGSFQGSNVDFDPGAGTANLSSAGSQDIFIAKYDASGNYVWANRIGGSGADGGYDIALDGSGNVFVSGIFSGSNIDFDPGAGAANLSSAAGTDVFIAKYDASGNYVWANRTGGSGTDFGTGLALDGSGNVHVTGYFAGSNVDFDPGAGTANLSSAGAADIFVAKYDASGNYVWAIRAGGTSDEFSYGIAIGSNGKVNIGGSFAGTADFDPGAGTANRTTASLSGDIFIAQYASFVSTPEIDVQGSGQSISDGDSSPGISDDTDFGNQSVCNGSVVRTYTIKNTGDAALHITAISLSGANMGDFTVGGISLPADVAAAGSTTFSATFNPSAPGVRNAILTITNDDADENSYDFAIMGTGIDLPAPTLSGSNPVCTGATLSLTGSPGVVLPSTAAWASSDDAVATVDGSGVVSGVTAGPATITYTVTDNSGCSSGTSVAVTVLPCTFFSGNIEWYNSVPGSIGVNETMVNLGNTAAGSCWTDMNGDYDMMLNATGNFTVTPVKNSNKLNGITVADIAAIQQHVANTVLITDPYRQAAADVNKSNSITTFDATIINQALLGSPSGLTQFKTSWRFVPQSHTMSLPPWGFPENISLNGVSGNQAGNDFYGIKTGDIVAGYGDPANFGPVNPLILRVEDRMLESGTEITVGFVAGQTDDLVAWQFALSFDPSNLQLIDIQPTTVLPLTTDHFGTYNIAEGEIRSVWSQPTGAFLDEGTVVFNLRFAVLQSGVKLSEVLQLAESVLPALSYTGALLESKVLLEYYEVTATGPNTGAAEYCLLQNTPNPFSDKTTVTFVLPGACDVALRVFDTSGRLLQEHVAYYAAGRHRVEFDFGNERAGGVLYYELTTPFGVLTKRMALAQH